MKETQAVIQRVKQINDTHQHVVLAVDESLTTMKPGQSLLARETESWHPYLREHWWPVASGKNSITVERPTASRYVPGQVVSLLGLVGQPFRFRRTLRTVLLMAYDTPPTPLLMTIPWLLGNNIAVTMVLLGSATEYKTEHLPPELEVVLGEVKVEPDSTDFQWPSRVTTVGWADQVFVAVAQDNEAHRFSRVLQMFGQLRSDVPKNYLFGVFRPILPCGVGACYSCTMQTKDAQTLVCTDGPALDLTLVKL